MVYSMMLYSWDTLLTNGRLMWGNDDITQGKMELFEEKCLLT